MPDYDPKNMRFRYLGRTGLQVPVFSLGGWLTYGGTVKGDPVKDCMKTAFDLGINLFDTAEVYANGECELEMGRVIREMGWKREELIITTKICFGTGSKEKNGKGLSRKHLIEGTRASLKRLGLDYVDLLYAHRPDPNAPMEEIVRGFNYCLEHGYAFYWGTSEWSAAQLAEANEVALRLNLIGPSVEQPQYSMLERTKVEKDFVPIYEKYGLGLTVWSPLKFGILTGKYNDGIPEGSRFDTNKSGMSSTIEMLKSDEGKAMIEKVRKLSEVAKRLDTSNTILALAWCVANPRCTNVILGATKPEQIVENVKALDIVDKLTPELMREIDGILQNNPNAEESK